MVIDFTSANLIDDPALSEALGRVKLVLMDIDGTLITGPSQTLDTVLLQLKRLRAKSIRFSLATGRSLFGIGPILTLLRQVHARIPPVIAYNGGVVAWPPGPNAVLDRNVLPPDHVQQTIAAFGRRSLQIFVYTCNAGLDLNADENVYGPRLTKNRVQEFNGMPVTPLSFKKLTLLPDVVAILGAATSKADAIAAATELRNILPAEVRIQTSGTIFVEVASAMSTKLNGMLHVASALNLCTEQIMAIGDNYNDLEMIQGAGVGVAVANAPDKIKQAARIVCRRSGSEGVVEALRLLLEAIRLHKLQARVQQGKGDGD